MAILAARCHDLLVDPGIIVVFRSRLRDGALPLKEELNETVAAAAPSHPGLLSWKSFDAPDGERVTIVEFVDEEAYRAWVREPAHVAAKARRLEVYEELSTTVGAVTEPVRRWAAPS